MSDSFRTADRSLAIHFENMIECDSGVRTAASGLAELSPSPLPNDGQGLDSISFATLLVSIVNLCVRAISREKYKLANSKNA